MAESSHAKDNDIGGRLALITGASGGYFITLSLQGIEINEKLGSDEHVRESWYYTIATSH